MKKLLLMTVVCSLGGASAWAGGLDRAVPMKKEPVQTKSAPVRVMSGENFWAVGAGIYDVNDDQSTGEARLEYRWTSVDVMAGIHPFVGGTITGDSAIYGYFGLGYDGDLGGNWYLNPNAAVGLYEDGDGKDLGNTVEFRTGLELGYKFEDRTRLGVAAHHISNAGLGSDNPGTESIMLMYSIPTN